MLYALGDPRSFAFLLVFALVCVTLSGWVSALVASRQGSRSLKQEGRLLPDPRRQVDPFGAVSAVIAGIGWHKPVDVPRTSAGRVATAVLAGPVVLLAIGIATLVGFGIVYGDGGASVFSGDAGFVASNGAALIGQAIDAGGGANALQNGLPGLTAAAEAFLLFGLAATWTGAIQLVPLPPLPGGQVLFAAAPRTLGWQKAEYQLVERNIGTAVLLALMLIPLGSNVALLPNILDNLLGPLVKALLGG